MMNSNAPDDSALISAMESHSFDSSSDSKMPQIHLSSDHDALRIPSPASTVYISTPINDNVESTAIFPMEHQDSFDLRNNSPSIEKDLDATTLFTSVTSASQYGMLSNAIYSPDLANNQEETVIPVPDKSSSTESICTATSSTTIEPEIQSGAPPSSDTKSGISPENASDACQQSIAESYITLTPWTTKFVSNAVGQIPMPNDETCPVPLISLNQHVCIPNSSNSAYVGPQNLKLSSNSVYSKIGSVSTGSSINETRHSHARESAGVKTGVKNLSSLNVGLWSMHKPTIKIKSTSNKEHRFKKTADALQKSGLWEVAIKTGNLIKRNRELQRDLEQFRADALLFLKSVIKNPHNRDYIRGLFNSALSANMTHQKKMTMMNVVAAAAAATVKLKASSSMHDSGVSSDGRHGSSGSQSDQSVTNFPCTKLETSSPKPVKQMPMETI